MQQQQHQQQHRHHLQAPPPPSSAHHHHHPHYHQHQHQHQHHHQLPYEVAPPNVHVQHIMEQQVAEELRKNAKRAANRRSASTCRARKKFLVDNMAQANDRMRKRSRVLSLLPDMILAMRRDGVVTYASENCRQFVQFTREVCVHCCVSCLTASSKTFVFSVFSRRL